VASVIAELCIGTSICAAALSTRHRIKIRSKDFKPFETMISPACF